MSGGSFGYLCVKDGADLIGGFDEDLRGMRDALAAYEGSAEAVRLTDDLIARVAAARSEYERIARELNEAKRPLDAVFKAVEWEKSCDWSVDRVAEALNALKVG